MKIKRSQLKEIIKEVIREGATSPAGLKDKPAKDYETWRAELEYIADDVFYIPSMKQVGISEREIKQAFKKRHKTWTDVLVDLGLDPDEDSDNF